MDIDAAYPHILVVDDDSTTLDLICSLLEANGCVCVAASSGEEALDLILTTPNILIAISDINMPGIDGITLLERVNALAASKAPRVIFLTANPTAEYAVAALRLGAIDFLTKPVRPQDLLNVVRNAILHVQQERAVANRWSTISG
jgi:putative two-component system response regulator